MVEKVGSIFLYYGIKIGKIDHHPRFRVWLAFDRHFKNVVVSMPVRIAALSEYSEILIIAKSCNTADMGCTKFSFSA